MAGFFLTRTRSPAGKHLILDARREGVSKPLETVLLGTWTKSCWEHEVLLGTRSPAGNVKSWWEPEVLLGTPGRSLRHKEAAVGRCYVFCFFPSRTSDPQNHWFWGPERKGKQVEIQNPIALERFGLKKNLPFVLCYLWTTFLIHSLISEQTVLKVDSISFKWQLKNKFLKGSF